MPKELVRYSEARARQAAWVTAKDAYDLEDSFQYSFHSNYLQPLPADTLTLSCCNIILVLDVTASEDAIGTLLSANPKGGSVTCHQATASGWKLVFDSDMSIPDVATWLRTQLLDGVHFRVVDIISCF